MKQFQHFAIIVSIILIVTSCRVSNNVVNNGLIQKRKYTTGWFVKTNSKQEKKSSDLEAKAKNEDEIPKGSIISTTLTNIPMELNEEQLVTVTDNPELSTNNAISESSEINLSFQNTDMKVDLTQEVSAIENRNFSIEIVQEPEGDSEEINKVAVYGFTSFIGSVSFLALGFYIFIISDAYFLIIAGLFFLLMSIILSILALTKFKHQKKRKILAKITLYTLLIAPVILFIIGMIAMLQSSYFG